MGKGRTVIICLALLFFVLLSATEVKLAKADTTIIINQNGAVESTDLIERNGDNYRFIGDIDVPIIVERNNIDINGNGYTLKGSGVGYAINLTTSNVTVQHLNIVDWDVGILGVFNENRIINNVITGCNYGININADGYYIFLNYIANNDEGIRLGSVSGLTFIAHNNITNNGVGLTIIAYASDTGNTVTKNVISNNQKGIYVYWHKDGITQKIYRNNFLNNTLQASTYGDSPIPFRTAASTWNSGSELNKKVGNYWSDYNGTDNDNDGIGDIPYPINEYDSDIYPLMLSIGLEIIPEFPSWTILPLFLVVTISVIAFKKRMHFQRGESN